MTRGKIEFASSMNRETSMQYVDRDGNQHIVTGASIPEVMKKISELRTK